METGRLRTAEQERIAGVVEHWSEFLLREVFEDGVDDMDLDQMDEASALCGDLLAQKLAAALLQRRGAPLEEAVCPDCHTHCDIVMEDRTLLLRRGEVRWSEPKSHCSRCERDFFPSQSDAEG